MQLLEYMTNPGTGWKSQDEQLIELFKKAHETAFELPEGADIPELVFLFPFLLFCQHRSAPITC